MMRRIRILLAALPMTIVMTFASFTPGFAAIQACHLTIIGPYAPADVVLPPGCPNPNGTIGGDAKQLAQQIIDNPKIKLSAQARGDIQATIDGTPIQKTETCDKPVTLSPALLKLILEIAQSHSYDLNYIVSSHHCNNGFHPKGRGMDIGLADGTSSWKNTQFRQDVANLLPAGGGLGQQGCPGSAAVTGKNQIRQFADTCNHQHVDVGGDAQ